jgi:hypothetical protein
MQKLYGAALASVRKASEKKESELQEQCDKAFLELKAKVRSLLLEGVESDDPFYDVAILCIEDLQEKTSPKKWSDHTSSSETQKDLCWSEETEDLVEAANRAGWNFFSDSKILNTMGGRLSIELKNCPELKDFREIEDRLRTFRLCQTWKSLIK